MNHSLSEKNDIKTGPKFLYLIFKSSKKMTRNGSEKNNRQSPRKSADFCLGPSCACKPNENYYVSSGKCIDINDLCETAQAAYKEAQRFNEG